MSRDINELTTNFHRQVEELLQNCAAGGYEMRPFFTLRSPQEQGKLWRQSRSSLEIFNKISFLQAYDASFLAECIEQAGPQYGRRVTDAIPGFSWHQWGEALDCYWLLDGRAEWSARKKVNGENGYHFYADRAEELGLTAGGHWKKLKDWAHVQLRVAVNPGKTYTLREIDEIMRERFGGD